MRKATGSSSSGRPAGALDHQMTNNEISNNETKDCDAFVSLFKFPNSLFPGWCPFGATATRGVFVCMSIAILGGMVTVPTGCASAVAVGTNTALDGTDLVTM